VQTVKQLMRKAVESKQDVAIALLQYRNAPVAGCDTARHSFCSIILCAPNYRLYQQRTAIRNTATYNEGKIARRYIMTGIRIHRLR